MKNRRRLNIAFLLPVACFTVASFGQHPDFSGTWKLNESESTLDQVYSFAPLEITIEQAGQEMITTRVSEYQGNRIVRSSSYVLEGTNISTDRFQGAEVTSTAQWIDEGKALEIVTSFEKMDGGPLTITSVYSMKGDQLVISNAVEGGPISRDPETWVFHRP